MNSFSKTIDKISSLVGGWPQIVRAAPPILKTMPTNPWPGYSAHGRWLCQGAFSFADESLPLLGNYWSHEEISDSCAAALHGFEWLRDLKSYGGEVARRQAREMIHHWIDHHPGRTATTHTAWEPNIIGRRISVWLAMFEFTHAGADEDLRAMFLASVNQQAKFLARILKNGTELKSIDLMQAAKGLCFAGVAFEERGHWLGQGLRILESEIPHQILSDGTHISRSPEAGFHALKLCLEVNAALAQGKYGRSEILQHAIDRLIPAIRFFRHGDKKFCTFHQGDTLAEMEIDAVLSQVDGKIRIPRSLPHGGYERAAGGRSALIMDCGMPPQAPYDAGAHASPLAFEFSHGRERIFVNCGTHRGDKNWAEILRCSAAHNLLTLDDRNVLEIRADGRVGKRVGTITADRFDAQGGMIIDASHNGYESITGLIHRRRLFLSHNGCDLRGEDTLEYSQAYDMKKEDSPTQILERQINVAIRFHLHPRVLISLIQQGRECLLRTQTGQGWRFYHIGGEMRLENSVYLGEGGEVRKTKQIVIYAHPEQTPATIQWALQKESGR